MPPRPLNAARRAVDSIPTMLGRLVFLSSMLNETSGTYEPHLVGIPSEGGPEFGALHRELLITWLSAPSETQVADAAEYLQDATVPLPHARLLPPGADPLHRRHFLETLPYILVLASNRSPGSLRAGTDPT